MLLNNKPRLTKRAPDAGDSAQISGSFTRLSLFLAGRLRRPRPSAGNANRWAAKSVKNPYHTTQQKEQWDNEKEYLDIKHYFDGFISNK